MASRKERRNQRRSGKKEGAEQTMPSAKPETHKKSSSKEKSPIIKFYKENYKKLAWIPIILIVLSLLQIGMQVATTGDFVSKGISLKGGVSVTIESDELISTNDFESYLIARGYDANVRELRQTGQFLGVIIDTSLPVEDSEKIDQFIQDAEGFLGRSIEDQYSVEGIGSSLGETFFKQTIFAILLAFAFMGIVVFIYFRTVIPSVAVILCALCDMICTLAVVNLLDVKLSTAGIAAFLMLIGYSVDTDLLLTIKVLKGKHEDYFNGVLDALKTGLIMNTTTLAAILAALLFTSSDTIRQIMLILLIGLVFDMVFTWIQNVGILRMYMERSK